MIKNVFADTHFWVAIVKPRDPWKDAAKKARARLGESYLVTTDEVLCEFLAALSEGGEYVRKQAVKLVRRILDDPNVRIIPQSRDTFLKGLSLYENRSDKTYSLTDCVSMNVMRAEDITEVLSNDRHFKQEGFTVLIRKEDR